MTSDDLALGGCSATLDRTASDRGPLRGELGIIDEKIVGLRWQVCGPPLYLPQDPLRWPELGDGFDETRTHLGWTRYAIEEPLQPSGVDTWAQVSTLFGS